MARKSSPPAWKLAMRFFVSERPERKMIGVPLSWRIFWQTSNPVISGISISKIIQSIDMLDKRERASRGLSAQKTLYCFLEKYSLLLSKKSKLSSINRSFFITVNLTPLSAVLYNCYYIIFPTLSKKTFIKKSRVCQFKVKCLKKDFHMIKFLPVDYWLQNRPAFTNVSFVYVEECTTWNRVIRETDLQK